MTVALLKGGEIAYHMYGENGNEIPPQPMLYKIGSLTKTMTPALIQKGQPHGLPNIFMILLFASLFYSHLL